ncbi:MAG: TusE/DsrC/DsvC family sulfur relay protein [Prolixibacteraceae bacterium]|jgi:tRNA 2-thiouridine synthesizing protein E|nr:TusE/DsrC/DsvC family sulfur relay protein [Prolixibacteraceae bacterium]MDD4754549.1 TusE/DsrC/DsvC family sulfur relay protein [Prolixibacteraceae bacterium]NLO03333.1 TusE/DsrC/DsvC family sulfur relay protein [Bacteroidales bacterium]
MAQKNYAGKQIEVTEEGYLVSPDDWTKELAVEMAKEDGIELSDKHFEVLEYLRKEYAAGTALSIRKVGKSGIVDIKGLYSLFPGGPLKLSSKYAGIPKPASCV